MIVTNCENNSQGQMAAITISSVIEQELDKFENLISSLEKKKKDLSDKIKEHEGKVKKEKECSDAWQKCLKTREEKKDSLHKEIKSRFIPCVLKKNTEMFHRCLVCVRKTAACSFKRKQDVALSMIKEKLFKQQLEMAINEIKDIEKSLEFLRKIEQECGKIKEEEGYIEKTFKKIKVIKLVESSVIKLVESSKMEGKNENSYTNFDDFFKKSLMETDTWKDFAKTADQKEISKFRQDVENFYIANKRISDDLNLAFIRQVKKRCKILRSYDEGGRNFLKILEKEAKSLEKEAFSSKIEACRGAYEKERDEYKKSISTVENNYNKAIEIFAKISKSQKLNCLEQNCIKKYSCDACKTTGECSALRQELECYEAWECINTNQIKFQQGTLGKHSQPCQSVNYATLKKNYINLNNKEGCYNEQSQNHLDCWEASLPDSVWVNILQYEEASNIIESIQDSIIRKKEEDVAKTVQALGGVLYCAEQKKREREKFFIQHAYAVIKEQVAYVEKNKDERMKVCLRGEANTFVGQDLYWVIPEMLDTRFCPNSDPNNKASNNKECDPYSIVDVSKLGSSSNFDFQDFDERHFTISCDLRGKSRIDMCNFVPLCQSQHSCVDKALCGDLKCDDEPCCPQPSCCGQEAGQTCGQQDGQGQGQTGGQQTETEPDGEPVMGCTIG